MTVSKVVEWEVPVPKPPRDENIFPGAWESGWEVPEPRWSKKSENRHIEKEKNNFTLPASILPHVSTAQWQERPLQPTILPTGESESEWAPNCPSLEECCPGGPLFLIPPRTEGIGMADSTWGTAHKSQQLAVDPTGWLVDTRRCEKRKGTSVKYLHSIEGKLLSA